MVWVIETLLANRLFATPDALTSKALGRAHLNRAVGRFDVGVLQQPRRRIDHQPRVDAKQLKDQDREFKLRSPIAVDDSLVWFLLNRAEKGGYQQTPA